MAATACETGRLAADLAELGRFGADGDGISRFAWSDAQMDASRWLVGRLQEVGLEAGIDAAGNVIGKWHAPGPALVIGSHIDTVPDGGRYDGALGVLAGLEALRRLRERGFVPRRPVWLAAFNDEEGAGFGTAMLGSRAFAGEDVSDALQRTDRSGTSVAAAMARQGFDADRLAEACAIDAVAGYLELHVEQGPLLESRGCDIGAVTAVAGVLGVDVSLHGEAGHAGTTPISMRRDALVGAARAITGLRDLATRADGVITTVGTLDVEPGGFNVIPGACRFSVDVRAGDAGALDAAERDVRAIVRDAAEQERVAAEVRVVRRLPPAAMDRSMVAAVAGAARAAGAGVLEMVSGAGHDAMVLARHVPAAVVFVPSRGGISHSPLEHTSERHCEIGAEVLARVVEQLDAVHRNEATTEENRA